MVRCAGDLVRASDDTGALAVRLLAETLLVLSREGVTIVNRSDGRVPGVSVTSLVPLVLCLSCGHVASRCVSTRTKCPHLGAVGSVQAVVDIDTMKSWCVHGVSSKESDRITEVTLALFFPRVSLASA